MINHLLVFSIILCTLAGTINLQFGSIGVGLLCFIATVLNGILIVRKLNQLKEGE